MFGQKPFGTSAFGAATSNQSPFAGAAGAASTFGTAPTFGAPAAQSAFGAPNPSGAGGLFGGGAGVNPQGAGGGLFGSGGGLSTQSAFGGGFGAGSAAPNASAATFGSSAFKPATSGFGGFGQAAQTSTGLFGSAAQPAAGPSAMFGSVQPQQTQQMGGFGGGFGAGAAQFGMQQQLVGTTVKFNPTGGTDTMMKGGTQQNINTRHQCITCMKEYENKSLEELRMEDYAAGRKGALGGGLFGAGAGGAVAPNQTVSAGGLFGGGLSGAVGGGGGGLFGSQAAKQPLFGATTVAGGFGTVPTSTFGSTAGGFGAAGGAANLFGPKPAATGAFGVPAAASSSSGFGFGAVGVNSATSMAPSLFGQQQQQAKPAFGQPATGSLFGSGASTAPQGGGAFGTFGTQSAFGQPAGGSLFDPNKTAGGFGLTAPTAVSTAFGGSAGAFGSTTAFGQPQQQPDKSGLAFSFGPSAASSAPFGSAGTANTFTSGTVGGAFGQPQQPNSGFFGAAAGAAKPAFGGFGAPAAGQQPQQSSGFGFGQPLQQQQQQPPAFGSTGLFSGAASAQQKPTSLFGTGTAAAPGFGGGAATGTSAFGATTGGFGTGIGGSTAGFGSAFGGFGAGTATSSAFGASTLGGGAAAAGTGGLFGVGGTGLTGTSSGLGTSFMSQPLQQQQTSAFQQQQQQPFQMQQQQQQQVLNGGGSVQDYLISLASNPYGDNPLFGSLVPGSTPDKVSEMLKPTNPAAQRAALIGGGGGGTQRQYKLLSPRTGLAETQGSSSSSGSRVKLKPLRARSGDVTGGGLNRSSLFDGLEDDEVVSSSPSFNSAKKGSSSATGGDIFVPRSNVKKLVLKARSPLSASSPSSAVDDLADHSGAKSAAGTRKGVSFTQESAGDASVADVSVSAGAGAGAADCEESLMLNLPRAKELVTVAKKGASMPLEDSYTSLNAARKAPREAVASRPSAPPPEPTSPDGADNDSSLFDTTAKMLRASPGSPEILVPSRRGVKGQAAKDGAARENYDDDDDGDGDGDEENRHPAGITLRRAQYYTIPSFTELVAITEKDGNCFVENFTIGRAGYGNIFFPGITNVKGMNFDEIVFFRHKEVIVYPDDSKKPPLGEGLNRRAQVTLDKVWPIDKTKQVPIVSVERLLALNFEEKLQRTSIKLGARFVEYRPETGSWVFKVDHFSKYGLDDSDDENEDVNAATGGARKDHQHHQMMKPGVGNVMVDNKKQQLQQVKTLELRDVDASNIGGSSRSANTSSTTSAGATTTTTKATVHIPVGQGPPTKLSLQHQQKPEDLRTMATIRGTLTSTSSSAGVMSPSIEALMRLNALGGGGGIDAGIDTSISTTGSSKVKMMKMALFDDDDAGPRQPETTDHSLIQSHYSAPNIDISKLLLNRHVTEVHQAGQPQPRSRPVILETRKDPAFSNRSFGSTLEPEVTSYTSARVGQGLGGFFSLPQDHLQPPTTPGPTTEQHLYEIGGPPSMLLKHGPTGRKTADFDTIRQAKANSSAAGRSFPRYSLQSAYDQYVELSSSATAPRKQQQQQLLPKNRQVGSGPEIMTLLSASNDRLRLVADAGLFMGRSFRAGWGSGTKNCWTVWHSGLSSALEDDDPEDPAVIKVDTVDDANTGDDDTIVDSLECWLDACLTLCSVKRSEDSDEAVPYAEWRKGNEPLHLMDSEATRQLLKVSSNRSNNELGQYLRDTKDVWGLMMALWGDLPDYCNDDSSVEDMDVTNTSAVELEERPVIKSGELEDHNTTMRRKEALESWLLGMIRDGTEKARKGSKASSSSFRDCLELLFDNQLMEACDRAQDGGNHYAAILMSQKGSAGCGQVHEQWLSQYLGQLEEDGSYRFVSQDLLTLVALVAGIQVWGPSSGQQQQQQKEQLNALDQLPWLKAFGVIFWYLSNPVSSIPDSLEIYEKACGLKTAATPLPSYADQQQDKCPPKNLFDLKYHLLKLYSDRAHRIEEIVDPATFTGNCCDHRLGWLVSQVLSSLGYNHLSEARRLQLHLEFASQLESMGLWHWSAFILLHVVPASGSDTVEMALQRKKLICDLITRNVSDLVPSCPEQSTTDEDKERFLVDCLKVPAQWLAEAKATYAATALNDFERQAWYLIQARCWNEAHDVIVRKIAPDAVVDDDLALLPRLLGKLASEEVSGQILGWEDRGGVYHDFIEVDFEVRGLLEELRAGTLPLATLGFHIERLRPRVTSLCGRIGSLPALTARERLCQSEMSKKVLNLMRALLSLDKGDDGGELSGRGGRAKVLVELLSQLPLPDDYELQELRAISRMYMLELRMQSS